MRVMMAENPAFDVPSQDINQETNGPTRVPHHISRIHRIQTVSGMTPSCFSSPAASLPASSAIWLLGVLQSARSSRFPSPLGYLDLCAMVDWRELRKGGKELERGKEPRLMSLSSRVLTVCLKPLQLHHNHKKRLRFLVSCLIPVPARLIRISASIS